MCLWDEKGATKVHQALEDDILDFIKQAQAVSSTTPVLAKSIRSPVLTGKNWFGPVKK